MCQLASIIGLLCLIELKIETIVYFFLVHIDLGVLVDLKVLEIFIVS